MELYLLLPDTDLSPAMFDEEMSDNRGATGELPLKTCPLFPGEAKEYPGIKRKTEMNKLL